MRKSVESPPQPGDDSESRDYEADLVLTSASCSSREKGGVDQQRFLTRESYPPQHRIDFNGTIITSTPCQELNYSVSRENNNFTMNIQNRPSKDFCVECRGTMRYNASFEFTGEDFELVVQHNGEEIKTFRVPRSAGPRPDPGSVSGGDSPDLPDDPVRPRRKHSRMSPFAGIFSWFSSLF